MDLNPNAKWSEADQIYLFRNTMVIILFLEIKSTFMANTIGDGKLLMVTVINLHLSTKLTGKMKLKDILITERF